jgi:hypothetical protein
MSDLDDFLATTLARQVQAEEALHNGDPGPRLCVRHDVQMKSAGWFAQQGDRSRAG